MLISLIVSKGISVLASYAATLRSKNGSLMMLYCHHCCSQDEKHDETNRFDWVESRRKLMKMGAELTNLTRLLVPVDYVGLQIAILLHVLNITRNLIGGDSLGRALSTMWLSSRWHRLEWPIRSIT
jgi:hypothetical protein